MTSAILASALTDSMITTQDVFVFSVIIGIFIALAKGLVWFLDRFYGKKDTAAAAAEMRQLQSESCKYDHSNIAAVLASQNAHITKLLEHMGTFLHTAELRHQALLGTLAADKAEVVERLKNIYHQMPRARGAQPPREDA